jgi:cytochrome P450
VTNATEELAFSLDSPEVKENPYPILHRLRAEDPVHWVSSMQLWLVTRHADIKSLFTDPRVVPDRRAHEFYKPAPEGSYIRWIEEEGLFAIPTKEHLRQRRLLATGFTPRGVARMDGQIRQVVERWAEPLAHRTGVVEIMSEFTSPIPNAVISAITGVGAPGNDERHFSRLAQEVVQGFFGFVSDEIKERAEIAFLELSGWVRATIEERRKEPQEDLISDLVNARDGDDRLSDDNIVAQVAALLAAGSETTATGGMLAITTLLDHPEELEKLRVDRGLVPQAVSEILRFGFGGIGGMQRFAAEDFELHGKQIRKGQMLVLSMGGASHDDAVYPDPEKFDIHRSPKDLLTFGVGSHFCLGSNLARGELKCMIDAALDFLPEGARVLRDQMNYQNLGIFDRPMSCPIDFGPTPRAATGG